MDESKKWNPERTEDEVRIILEKLRGSGDFQCAIQANSATAAINGIAQLIVKLAENTEQSVERIIAVLATVLLYREET